MKKIFLLGVLMFLIISVSLTGDALGNGLPPTAIMLSGNTVSEDAPNNTLIGILSGTDPDGDPLTFRLPDDAGGRFKISGTELRLSNYTLIDYDTNPSHSITVQVDDGYLAYRESFTIKVTKSPYIKIDSTAAAELRGRPSIATDGEKFFAVWRDTITGSSKFFGARITPDGVNLDPGRISIGGSSLTSYGINPAVAFDGTNYLVVWVDTDGEIYAVRLTSGGVVIDNQALKITTGAYSKERPVSIAFCGTNYLIAWRNIYDEVKVARVSTSGAIIDDPGGITIGSGFYPWVASDGKNYLVVWHGWGSGGLDIFGNRISSATGTVLDGSGFVICEAAEDQDHSSVAFDGTNYLVVWHDFRGGDIGYNDGTVYGARVSTDGVVLDNPAIQISDLCRGQWPVTVASDGKEFLVVWQVDNWHIEGTELVDVFAQRISKAGALVGEKMPICTAHGHQWGPQVAFNKVSKYITIWTEGGPYDRATGVWGSLIDAKFAKFNPSILSLLLNE
jgi:hypothetical protein